LTLHSNDFFSVVSSETSFPAAKESASPNLWKHAEVPAVFNNTPLFYQHLLNTPLSEAVCQEIAMEIKEEQLVTCSDGACDINTSKASHGSVYASNLLQQTIATASGPVDGNPSLVTSYRAELSGIVAVLYTIYRICEYYQVTSGTMTLYCDNKGAFTPIRPGITLYFKTDHDLLEVTQSLLQLIPITIATQWMKGHYTGLDRQYQHTLNETADQVAGEYQRFQYPHRTIRKPIPPPDYRVRLLHDDSVITSKIKQTLSTSLHDQSLVDYIMRKACWPRQTFDMIHWDGHERAFKRLPRFSRHSMAKLLHGLVNTNRQNKLFYGTSASCPICHSTEETLQHVFTCMHPSAVEHRQARLSELLNDLTKAGTPDPIVQAVRHGFLCWVQKPTSTDIRSLTAGSLRGPDAVLTTAFLEQVQHIGWYHLCLGGLVLNGL